LAGNRDTFNLQHYQFNSQKYKLSKIKYDMPANRSKDGFEFHHQLQPEVLHHQNQFTLAHKQPIYTSGSI
jgi:hypothetical protein